MSGLEMVCLLAMMSVLYYLNKIRISDVERRLKELEDK